MLRQVLTQQSRLGQLPCLNLIHLFWSIRKLVLITRPLCQIGGLVKLLYIACIVLNGHSVYLLLVIHHGGRLATILVFLLTWCERDLSFLRRHSFIYDFIRLNVPTSLFKWSNPCSAFLHKHDICFLVSQRSNR